MAEEIVNRIASSALQQIDLEEFYPKEEVVVFDLKPFLFMELILKEKDFREKIQQVDWHTYTGKVVAVTCSSDAVIPMWAYMLITVNLQPHAKEIVYGNADEALKQLYIRNIQHLDITSFRDQRVVVKGCGDLPIGEYAYLEITKRLRPVVKSIMYGEPCSTVPIYKAKALKD
jgi:hypothetical protein